MATIIPFSTLNTSLVSFCVNTSGTAPVEVENRTQAIQHRIDNAGITRKIGTNQVHALRVMLSGAPEDMHRIIVVEGRLDEWCADNLDWLRKTFGAENVVAADLHRDEQTPYIHATVAHSFRWKKKNPRAKETRE